MRNVIIVLAIVLLGAWYFTRDGELSPEEKYRQRFGSTESRTDGVMDKEGESMKKGEKMMAQGDGMNLTAQATGNGTVELSWNVDDDIIHTDDAKVYLLYGDKEDLMHDGNTFWWRHQYAVQEASWDNIPPGERYFRACFAPEGDTCTNYSDALLINVQ